LALVLKFLSCRISFLAFVTIHQQPFPLYDYYGIGGLTSVTSTHGTDDLSQGEICSTIKQTHKSARRRELSFWPYQTMNHWTQTCYCLDHWRNIWQGADYIIITKCEWLFELLWMQEPCFYHPFFVQRRNF
jgi:hypothetical protein